MTATLALVLAGVVLEVWNAHLHVPFTTGGDAGDVLAYMKTTIEQAWPLHNGLLGAPFGQDLHDYPLGDPVQIVLTKAISVVSTDVGVVTNLFYLATFPLTALASLWVLRRLGISTWTAVACAVLYALAPYHFLRGEHHLLIAAYYAVPLSCFLILRQLMNDLPSWRVTIVLAVVIGAAFTYYVVFTLILLGFAVLASLAARRRDVALRGGAALAVIAAVGFMAHLPTFIYHAQHGPNRLLAGKRTPQSSERFGLKLPRLVLPAPGHRLQPLDRLTATYNERSPSQLEEAAPQALGALGAAGFVWLLWVALTQFTVRGRARPRDPVVDAAAVATVGTTLLGLAGGASLLIAYYATNWLRSWNRLSIFIAFFAIVAVGKLLDRLLAWLAGVGVSAVVRGTLLVAIAVMALADQTTKGMVPDYHALTAAWRSDSSFVHRIENRLPGDAVVLELPYVPFPEYQYWPELPYLHSDRLRWTGGAMGGRPEDWTASLQDQPVGVILASAAAAGAQGVYIDRGPYVDGADRVSAQTQVTIRQRPLASADGRLEFYDLRPLASALRARLGAQRYANLGYRTLHPVRAYPSMDLAAPPQDAGPAYRSKAEIDLVNPLKVPRRVDVSLPVTTNQGTRVPFVIVFPNGERQRLLVPSKGRTLSGSLFLRPGNNRLTLTAEFVRRGSGFVPTFAVGAVIVADHTVTAEARAGLAGRS